MEITSLSKRYSEYSGIISRLRNARMVKTFVRLESSFVTYAGEFLPTFVSKLKPRNINDSFSAALNCFILVRNSD